MSDTVSTVSTTPAAATPNPAPAAPETKGPQGGAAGTNSSQPPVGGSVPGETPQQTADRIKLQLKLRGKEIEKEYSREELVRVAQLGELSGHNLREAARVQKEAEAREARLRERFAQDPWSVVQELGGDPRQLSESYLSRLLERELQSPEARRLLEAQERIAALEAEREQELTQRQQAEQQALTDRYAQQYNQEIGDLLKAGVPGVPNNPESVQRIAYYMLEGIQQGVDVTPQEAAKLVAEDYQGIVKGLLGGLDGAALAVLLGEDSLTKLRQWDVGRLKSPNTPPRLPNGQFAPSDPHPAPKPAKEPLTKDEWLAMIRQRTG